MIIRCLPDVRRVVRRARRNLRRHKLAVGLVAVAWVSCAAVPWALFAPHSWTYHVEGPTLVALGAP